MSEIIHPPESWPLVSVIIPTYNRSELLRYTLDSITEQRIDVSRFEVIVADDGSTDDTLNIVNGFSGKLNIRHVFQEDKGYRVASARNMGICASSGQILLFIDSGILLGPDCIEAHLRAHMHTCNDLAVLGYILFVEHSGQSIEQLKNRIDLLDKEKAIKKHIDDNEFLDFRESDYKRCNDQLMRLPAPWVLFWTGNVSVKKQRLYDLGLFDSAFDMCWGMEDIDIGYQLYKTGTKFLLNRTANSLHYPHLSDEAKKAAQEITNKQYFHKKHLTTESHTLLNCKTIELNSILMTKSTPESLNPPAVDMDNVNSHLNQLI